MLSTFFALALYIFTFATPASGSKGAAPGCVTKCWDYSQYVSSCLGDTRCLCDDAEFQNAVYQCLYSQCPTAQFGSALHYTLEFCSPQENKPQPTATVPALLRNQNDLRKRGTPTNLQSVSASAPSRPHRHASVSASAYMAYQTQRAYPKLDAGVADSFLKAVLNPYQAMHGARRRPDEPLFRHVAGDLEDL